MFVYQKPEQKQTTNKTIPKKEINKPVTSPNLTGIPDSMKKQFENLSGFMFDDVRVHYNSDKPAQLQALAYTQGNQVHIAPGHEEHLGHELIHVVQQKQGRVRPTAMINQMHVNDEAALEKEADRNQFAMYGISPKALIFKENVDTVQRRAADPYEMGGVISPQVHHIIPHSTMTSKLNLLPQAEQDTVKRSFMPDIQNITFLQLHNIFNRLQFVDNNNNNLVGNDNLNIPLVDHPNYKIIGLGFNRMSISLFRRIYDNIKGGAPIREHATSEFWTELLNSYFEWSAGNLFYGPQNRAEPGGVNLDDFDSDALFIRDKEHVNRLQAHYTRLNSAGVNDIREILCLIGEQNRNAGPGANHDRTKWYTPDTPEKKSMLLSVIPEGDRNDYIKAQAAYKTVPKQIILDSLKTDVPLRVLHYIKNYKGNSQDDKAKYRIPTTIKIADGGTAVEETITQAKLNIQGKINFNDVKAWINDAILRVLGLQ